jgi:hypothetical protein
MWFYEQIASSKAEPQLQEDGAMADTKMAVEVEQANTYELTSGEEDSSIGSSATPLNPPTTEEEEIQPDEGFEVDHFLKSRVLSKVSKSSSVNDDSAAIGEGQCGNTKSVASVDDAIADDASKVSKNSSAISSRNLNARNVSTEEEQGAIEVEAAGVGFSLKSWEDVKDIITVLSSKASDDESDLKSEKRYRRSRTKKLLFCIGAFIVISSICLIAGLAVGVERNSIVKKESSANSAASSNEEDTESDTVMPSFVATEVPDVNGTNATFAPSANSTFDSPPVKQDDGSTAPWQDDLTTGTDAPSATSTSSQSVVVTAAGTTMPTDISCGDDHNLIVASECQSDGAESWSNTRVLFCFSRTRDGDWYWIRGSESDYDRWDYTEGASEGTLEFDSIPPGDYLVSLVRDSMQPYDILLTETVTVPDCSTVRD